MCIGTPKKMTMKWGFRMKIYRKVFSVKNKTTTI